MNLLPHETLNNPDRPDGISIGVKEIACVGMGEQEMGRISDA